MNLGVSYGIFSGLELLKPSLLNIRGLADYVVGVWSPISSTGEPMVKYGPDLLESLKKEGLIDELIRFDPRVTHKPIEMQDNCRMKREIGRIRCVLAGCTHHLVRDCDEFHVSSQLVDVKCLMEEDDLDVVVSPIVEYVQNPTTRISGISGLYVPAIHRVELSLRRNNPFGVTVDMGRTVCPVKSFRVLSEDELVLHHYTSVRLDEEELRRKYQGHGHLNRVGTEQDFLNRVYGYAPDELEDADDLFGIQDYWRGEFQQWLNRV